MSTSSVFILALLHLLILSFQGINHYDFFLLFTLLNSHAATIFLSWIQRFHELLSFSVAWNFLGRLVFNFSGSLNVTPGRVYNSGRKSMKIEELICWGWAVTCQANICTLANMWQTMKLVNCNISYPVHFRYRWSLNGLMLTAPKL